MLKLAGLSVASHPQRPQLNTNTLAHWAIDSESGKSHGIDAVFFPQGSNWDGPVAIYPRVWQKDPGVALANVMEEDLRQYRQSFPDVLSTEAASIQISTTAVARVRYFKSESGDTHEAVAYVDQSRTVVILVLRSPAEAAFREALPSFEAFVRSFKPLLQLVPPAA